MFGSRLVKKIMIELKNISKIYGVGDTKVKALAKINLKIQRGDFIALVGPSGSGKSTLLNIIGCLDRPTDGFFKLEDYKINSQTSLDLMAKIRNQKIGFIFQSFNLLARTSALENVALPAIYSRLAKPKIKAKKLLEMVGLGKRLSHKPNELSGGEQQRVAIARALMNDPEIILADEPTGNLDSKSGHEITKLLINLNKKEGVTLLVATHNPEIADMADRVLKMRDGKII